MTRVAGSFRDPSGYVFQHGNRIFRALDAAAQDLLRTLELQGHLARWAREGLVVGTRFVEDPPLLAELNAAHPGFSAFLEHDRIDPITYPYEWSTSMLADAGRLTLRLQGELLQLGLSLKDATAYNIQFVRGKPLFIDLTSIEKPARLDLWFALGQFNRMFLYPLLLVKHAGWDLRSYFLSNLDGRSTLQVGQAFPFRKRWSPALLFDIGLPYALERRVKTGKASAPRPSAPAPGGAPAGHPAAQQMTLRRLDKKIGALANSIAPETVWGDYTQTCSYDDVAEASKKALVKEFLEQAQATEVLDIGCNTGDYSRIAAACGASVLATDFDIGAVEQMYRRLKTEPAAITPMVVDIANPSPGIGFLNAERPPFLERAKPDCVLALAVIHHLLVGANLPMAAIRDLYTQLTRKFLILEFVPTDDVMFRKLIEFRVNLFDHVTLDHCLDVFGKSFRLLRRESIRNSPRTLLLFEKT
ncbi:MAG TPA: class I SAM-dependent methyltransferase [Kiritimatiellia bacterium]|nr:class I SAM-dependent methyltransferase [Kiritimatiellia bacterium]HRX07293.1 class I SAM-dependent methyltransferase [Kiritimatiellia bacterium]